MKQKLVIGLSTALLILAIFLIARDLFRNSPASSASSCCNDDVAQLKQIDTALLAYKKIKEWDTGLKGLTGITVADNRILLCGDRLVAVFDTAGNRIGDLQIDSLATCILTCNNTIYVGFKSGAVNLDFNGKPVSVYSTSDQRSYITSIAADEDYVFLADAGRKRILKYTADGSFILEIGKKDGPDEEGFIVPSPYFDIACGGFNDVWAVNPGKLRLQNYTTDGKLRSVWGEDLSEESRFTGCCNPSHFTLLPDGRFVTYEKGTDKIKVFDQAGQFQAMVAGAGSFKGKPDFLLGNNNLVKDIATDQTGRIYILDAYNRINVFKKASDRK